jgi:hypothetical protein
MAKVSKLFTASIGAHIGDEQNGVIGGVVANLKSSPVNLALS